MSGDDPIRAELAKIAAILDELTKIAKVLQSIAQNAVCRHVWVEIPRRSSAALGLRNNRGCKVCGTCE